MANFRPKHENDVYVGDGVVATGVVSAEDTIAIDGKFDGEITCGRLIVGPSGVVNGRIVVSSADIYGEIGPDVSVRRLLTVRSTGRVTGAWTYGEIEVEKGGVLIGQAESNQVRSEHKAPSKEESSESDKLQKSELTLIENSKRLPNIATRALRNGKRSY